MIIQASLLSVPGVFFCLFLKQKRDFCFGYSDLQLVNQKDAVPESESLVTKKE